MAPLATLRDVVCAATLMAAAVIAAGCQPSTDTLTPLELPKAPAEPGKQATTAAAPTSAAPTAATTEPSADQEIAQLIASLYGDDPQAVADAYMKLVAKTRRMPDASVQELMHEKFIKPVREKGYSIADARRLNWVFINMLKDSVLAGHDPRPSFALLSVIEPLHRDPRTRGDGLNHDVEGTERTIDDPNLLANFVRSRAACDKAASTACRQALTEKIVALRLPAAIRDEVPVVPLADVTAEQMSARLSHSLKVFLPNEEKAQRARGMLKSSSDT